MKHNILYKVLRSPALALAVLAGAFSSAHAQVTVTSIISGPGNNASAIATPKAAFVDVYGNIFAAGAAGTDVVEIPANGGPLVTIVSGLSTTAVVQGVAADSFGNVYVTQHNTSTILKIAPNGSQTSVGSGFVNPYFMAFDAAQNLYVTDFGAAKVWKVPVTGTQAVLPFTGLGGVYGIALDAAGDVFVSGSGSTGKPLYELPVSSSGTGYGTQITYASLTAPDPTTGVQTTFNTARGIALDAAGNLYMVLTGTGQIIEFPAPIGTVPSIALPISVGGSGATVSTNQRGDVVVMASGGVTVLAKSAGNYYGTPVASTSKATVITFSFPTATTLATVPSLYTSNNSTTAQFKDAVSGDTCTSKKVIAAGGACILNVSFAPTQVGPVSGLVSLVDSTGAVIATVSLTGVGDAPLPAFTSGTQSTLITGLTAPTGIAVDSGGNVYTADPSTAKVTKTTAAGASTTLALTGVTRPTGIAVDGAGNVFVSDSASNQIVKLTPAGVQSTVTLTGLSTPLSAPKGIAVDGFNNLFIADSGNARVVAVSSTGTATDLGFTGLASPAFVAVDAQGDVFVSDAGKLYEQPIGAAQITILSSSLSAAAGLATSTSGTLFVADSGNGGVIALPPGATAFALASGLKTAAGLALAPSGNLYVADAGAGMVALIDRTRSTLTFPSTANGATSAALTAPLQNLGNAPLTNTALAITAGNSSFALASPAAATDCTSTTVLAASAICNIDVTFTPAALGNLAGTATVTDNALNATTATQSVSLIGTGIKASAITVAQTTPTSGNPVYGQAIRLTATVAPSPSSAGGTPTGNVIFTLDGATSGATVALTNGAAAFDPGALSAGAHTVLATYAGDAAFAASTAAKFTLTVAKAILTVTGVSQTREYNKPNATLTATIAGYVYGENAATANVTGVPTLATTATQTSVPNTYPITVDVTPLASSNYTFTAANGTLTVTQSSNVISFPAIANVTYGNIPLTPQATASSGLAITYKSNNTAVATVTNGLGASVTIVGAGAASITASQAGDANTAAATPVTITFTVAPAVLTVTADDKSKVQGAANPALTFTVSGFKYADTQASALGAGAPALATSVTPATTPGVYDITTANGNLSAANYTFTLVNGHFTVTGSTPQTITPATLPASATYGAAPIQLNATTTATGLTVSYTVSGPATLSGSNLLTITGAGTVTVTSKQDGNSTYAAASSITQILNVGKAAIVVTTPNVSRQINTPNPTFIPVYTGFVNTDTQATVISGAPAITTTADINSAVGVYPIGIALGTLTANNYTFSLSNTATLTVTATPQTITFSALPSLTYGASPITLAATASSALPIAYTVTGPASINSGVLTITGAGQVCVTATQPGNATYAAATPVQQCTTVARTPLTVTASDASITFGSPIPTTFQYTITGFVNAETASVVSGTPAINTTATSTSVGGVYPITPAIGTLSSTNYTFTTFVPGALTIGAAIQTITFAALPSVPQKPGTPITLTATASSGLPVTFTLGAGSVGATLNGNVLTITGPGTVIAVASQAGNSSYNAAAPVTQSFIVTGTTTTTLTTSLVTIYPGTTITLTAKVVGAITGLTPTGTVSFYSFTTLLNTTPVSVSSSGTATLNTSALTPGNDAITAIYSGDKNFSPSTSAASNVLVIAPDISVTASPSNLSVQAGNSVSTTLTITPVGNYSYLVNLSCGSLPANLQCSFSPPALTFYGGGAQTNPQTTVVTINATSVKAMNSTGGHRERIFAAFFALPLLAFFGARRRKLSLALLVLLISLGGLTSLTGCGTGPGPSAATYNVPVILDDGTGTTRTVTLTVTVTQ